MSEAEVRLIIIAPIYRRPSHPTRLCLEPLRTRSESRARK